MILPRGSLVTIYKSFIRPHLDHGDIIFHQAFNESIHDSLKSIQYNASLEIALSGISFRISPTKALVSPTAHLLQDIKNPSPPFLCKLLSLPTSSRITRSKNNITCFYFKHNLFFPSAIIEWNNLDILKTEQKIIVTTNSSTGSFTF